MKVEKINVHYLNKFEKSLRLLEVEQFQNKKLSKESKIIMNQIKFMINAIKVCNQKRVIYEG